LTGSVTDKGKLYQPELVIDKDERAVGGKCSCNFYSQNKMMQGPCEHMLALRIALRDKEKRQ
jgi:predicted nucleic acid-binding Zn finger protein